MIRKLNLVFKYRPGIFGNSTIERIADVVHRILNKSDEQTEEINKLIEKVKKQDSKIEKLESEIQKIKKQTFGN